MNPQDTFNHFNKLPVCKVDLYKEKKQTHIKHTHTHPHTHCKSTVFKYNKQNQEGSRHQGKNIFMTLASGKKKDMKKLTQEKTNINIIYYIKRHY